MHGVRTEYQIYKRIAFINLFANVCLLHHTTAQRDNQIGLGGFIPLNCADIAEHSVLCMLADGTGIVKNQIRFFNSLRRFIPHGAKLTADAFAVRHIALTAVGMYERFRYRRIIFRLQYGFYFFRKAALTRKLRFTDNAFLCH